MKKNHTHSKKVEDVNASLYLLKFQTLLQQKLSRGLLFAFFCLSLTLSANILLAQGTETIIRGRTLDTYGKPVSATINIKNEKSGFSINSKSDTTGYFTVRELPTGGPYTVIIKNADGEQKFTDQMLSQASDINLGEITLSAITELKGVEVRTQNSVGSQLDRVGSSVAITGRLLDQIPTLTRDFQSLATLSPQMSMRPPGSGDRYGISVGGVKPQSVGYSIDGVSSRMPVFGSNNPAGAAFIMSLEAISEFQVETNNYSVTTPRNGGGSIKAITRSGTNDFSGAAWSYGTGGTFSQQKDFNGNKINNNYSNYQVGARISGPIIKDKLTYVALYDRFEKSAPNAEGLLNYAVNPIDGSNTKGITRQNAQDILTIMNKHGMQTASTDVSNMTNAVTQKDVTQNLFLKLDYNINQVHKLSARVSYLDFKGGFAPGAYPGDYAYKDGHFGWASTSVKGLINLKSYFENGTFNDLKLNITTDNRFLTVPNAVNPTDPYPRTQVKVGTGNGIALGSPAWGGEQVYTTQYQLIDNFTFTKSGWNTTVGTDNLIYFNKEYYPHDTRGTYTFNSIADLDNNNPASLSRLIPIDGQPAKRYYEYPVMEFALYGETSKQLNKNLKLDLGLRWDGYFITKTAQANTTLSNNLGIKTASGISDWNNFQPRANLTWDINGDAKDVLKFGVGAFSSEFATHIYTFSLRGSGMDYRAITLNRNNPADAAILNQIGNNWSLPGSQQPGIAQIGANRVNNGPTNILTVDPKLQMPMTWKANTTYTKKVNDWLRTSLTGYFTYTANQGYAKILNITTPKDAAGNDILAPDGRKTYVAQDAADFGQVLQYTNANWASIYLGYTAEVAMNWGRDGIVNLSFSQASQHGESPYNAGSEWLGGTSVGYEYNANTYGKEVESWNSGRVINKKIVLSFSTPTFHGFSVAGTFIAGQFERFSILGDNSLSGLGVGGGGDGSVTGGALAYVYNPKSTADLQKLQTESGMTQAQSAKFMSDIQNVYTNASPEFQTAVNSSMSTYSKANVGLQPWVYSTNISLKKEFNLNAIAKGHKITLRADVFNPLNLFDFKNGINSRIVDTQLYTYDATNRILVANPNAGKMVKIFEGEGIFRVQFGLKYEF